jgi:hypothetical protein
VTSILMQELPGTYLKWDSKEGLGREEILEAINKLPIPWKGERRQLIHFINNSC